MFHTGEKNSMIWVEKFNFKMLSTRPLLFSEWSRFRISIIPFLHNRSGISLRVSHESTQCDKIRWIYLRILKWFVKNNHKWTPPNVGMICEKYQIALGSAKFFADAQRFTTICTLQAHAHMYTRPYASAYMATYKWIRINIRFQVWSELYPIAGP
jgi:hypothetical protein